MDDFDGMKGSVRAIAVHPLAGEGQRFLYAGGEDGEVRKWDDTGFLYPTEFKGHTKTVTCLITNEGGDLIISGAADNKVCVWRSNGEKVKELTALYTAPRALLLKDDALVVSDSTGNVYSFANWSGEEPATHTVLSGHRDTVVAMRSLESGFYTGSYDGTIRQWDFAAGKVTAVFSGHDGHVRGFAVAKEHLVSASRDGTVRVWPLPPPPGEDATKAARVQCLATVEQGELPSLLCQRGGAQTFLSTSEGDVRQLDAAMLVETALDFIEGNKKAYADATKTANASHAQYAAKQKKRCKRAVRKEQERLVAEAAAAKAAAAGEKKEDGGEEDAEEPPPDDPEDGDAAAPALSPEAEGELKRLTAELAQKYDGLVDTHRRKTEAAIADSQPPLTYDVPADKLWQKPYSRSVVKTRQAITAICAAEDAKTDVAFYYAQGATVHRKKCNMYSHIV
eukprot:TRINITY_DN2982_c1_g1_i1.p1 TRINITY_DN2982_c1_g1~~TRINITY_DN2982_c1_g1_i1.p1  ORF type:complete len:451 (+),score=150.16 TRINITY_DN2982_c1_g1_i1:170-1522(+)